jgi:hypothetical protein
VVYVIDKLLTGKDDGISEDEGKDDGPLVGESAKFCPGPGYVK